YARTGADPVLTIRAVSGHADEADSRLSAHGVQRQLADAIAGLTPADREVLLLIAWADLSYTEVAAALRIPVGTVRSRLHLARTRVRRALGGQDPSALQERQEQVR